MSLTSYRAAPPRVTKIGNFRSRGTEAPKTQKPPLGLVRQRLLNM